MLTHRATGFDERRAVGGITSKHPDRHRDTPVTGEQPVLDLSSPDACGPALGAALREIGIIVRCGCARLTVDDTRPDPDRPDQQPLDAEGSDPLPLKPGQIPPRRRQRQPHSIELRTPPIPGLSADPDFPAVTVPMPERATASSTVRWRCGLLLHRLGEERGAPVHDVTTGAIIRSRFRCLVGLNPGGLAAARPWK